MFDQLFSMFSSSRQGQGALQQLMGQGYTQQQATGMLQAALPAAAQAMQKAAPNFLSGAAQGGAPGAQGAAGGGLAGIGQNLLNIGGSHYAQNFLAGAVTGLLRGDGFMGAAVDGMQGVVGGHVAEVIASRFGLPSRVAGAIGAVITPWMIDFLWEKMQASGAGGAGGGFDLNSLFGGAAAGAGGMAGAFGGGASFGAGGNNYGGGLGYGAPSQGYGGGLAPPAPSQWVVPGAKSPDAGNKAVAGYGGAFGDVFKK
jgi:hypothetical protein